MTKHIKQKINLILIAGKKPQIIPLNLTKNIYNNTKINCNKNVNSQSEPKGEVEIFNFENQIELTTNISECDQSNLAWFMKQVTEYVTQIRIRPFYKNQKLIDATFRTSITIDGKALGLISSYFVCDHNQFQDKVDIYQKVTLSAIENFFRSNLNPIVIEERRAKLSCAPTYFSKAYTGLYSVSKNYEKEMKALKIDKDTIKKLKRDIEKVNEIKDEKEKQVATDKLLSGLNNNIHVPTQNYCQDLIKSSMEFNEASDRLCKEKEEQLPETSRCVIL